MIKSTILLLTLMAIGLANPAQGNELKLEPTPEYNEATVEYTKLYLNYLEKTSQVESLVSQLGVAKKERAALSERALKREISQLKSELKRIKEKIRLAARAVRTEANQLLGRVKSANRFLKTNSQTERPELYGKIDEATTYIRENTKSSRQWSRLSQEQMSAIISKIHQEFTGTNGALTLVNEKISAELKSLESQMNDKAAKVQVKIDPLDTEISRIESLGDFVKYSGEADQHWRNHRSASAKASRLSGELSADRSSLEALESEQSDLNSRLGDYPSEIRKWQDSVEEWRKAKRNANSRVSRLSERESRIIIRISEYQRGIGCSRGNDRPNPGGMRPMRPGGGNGGRRGGDCQEKISRAQTRLIEVQSKLSTARSDYSTAESSLSQAERGLDELKEAQRADEIRFRQIGPEITKLGNRIATNEAAHRQASNRSSNQYRLYKSAFAKLQKVKDANNYDNKVSTRAGLIEERDGYQATELESQRWQGRIRTEIDNTKAKLTDMDGKVQRQGDLPQIIAKKEKILTEELPRQQQAADEKIESIKASYAQNAQQIQTLGEKVEQQEAALSTLHEQFASRVKESGTKFENVKWPLPSKRWRTENVIKHPAFDRSACLAYAHAMADESLENTIVRVEIAGLKAKSENQSKNGFSEAMVLLQALFANGQSIARADRAVMTVYRENPNRSRRRTKVAEIGFYEMAAVENQHIKQMFVAKIGERSEAIKQMRGKWTSKIEFFFGGQVVGTIENFRFSGVTAALENDLSNTRQTCQLRSKNLGKYPSEIK